ncbi:cupin domain-containing protein [Actinomadura sp. J1-007]|uniref:cupin domain-containing protein n=1 Tax=Actinomadura sp. J1-007 TaxID=2661913 RepID=UPI0019D59EAA
MPARRDHRQRHRDQPLAARGKPQQRDPLPRPDRPRSAAGAPIPRQRATRGRVPPHEPGATAYVHRTDSLDYAYVIDGAIYSVLDSGETLMRPGDVLIQRGTNHAWDNRSDKPCTILFALLSATPLHPRAQPAPQPTSQIPQRHKPSGPLGRGPVPRREPRPASTGFVRSSLPCRRGQRSGRVTDEITIPPAPL